MRSSILKRQDGGKGIVGYVIRMASFKVMRKIRTFVNKMPGKRFKEFRFLPLCFVMGGVLEFLMIHWHVGEVNFYKTYKKRRIEEAVEQRLKEIY